MTVKEREKALSMAMSDETLYSLIKKVLGWSIDDPELPVYVIGDGAYASFDLDLISDYLVLDSHIDYWYIGQHTRIYGDLQAEEMLVVSLYD